MKKAVTSFFMAWGMFLSIPCPYRKWDDSLRPEMIVSYPFIGAVAGLFWTAAAYILEYVRCPFILSAVLLTVIPYLLTGFIHLDGFMDCCDAILSRRDAEERHRILKDSHVGSFAVIGLLILMMITFALFASGSLQGRELLLIFLPGASRAACALLIFASDPMEGSSYSGSFQELARPVHEMASAVILAAFAIIPVILFGACGMAPAVSAAGAVLAASWAKHQLGGMSGDISGFAMTIGELCGIAALILIP